AVKALMQLRREQEVASLELFLSSRLQQLTMYCQAVSNRKRANKDKHILMITLTSDAVDRFNVRIVPDNTVLLSFKLTVGRV
ncbi:MAG TPA: hypothetical protein VF982_03200, partial [Anaerolineales bacterium]